MFLDIIVFICLQVQDPKSKIQDPRFFTTELRRKSGLGVKRYENHGDFLNLIEVHRERLWDGFQYFSSPLAGEDRGEGVYYHPPLYPLPSREGCKLILQYLMF